MDLPRPVLFMLVSTAHGPMITPRLDGQPGAVNQLLDIGIYEPFEISCALDLLKMHRRHYGDGVLALDCGACIGTHSIEWSRLMTGWGHVIAIEAQERLYYAVAGNVTLNNCFNVQVLNAAVGNTDGVIRIPKPDFSKWARFGSIELKRQPDRTPEFVGQRISYEDRDLVSVNALRLDSLNLARVDLIKIDVEGMELETLEGARSILSTQRPILIIEIIKSNRDRIASFLDAHGYGLFQLGRLDVLAVHRSDKAMPEISKRDWSREAA
jgi:FkbM family methyltransferase